MTCMETDGNLLDWPSLNKLLLLTELSANSVHFWSYHSWKQEESNDYSIMAIFTWTDLAYQFVI